MNHTNDFIAHGLLPFVGRESEMEKILAFWGTIPEAQHLRIMLLTAEAGVGKSRLLEEALRAIRQQRGAVVHVKLYPEAANSLATLLARSLWTSPVSREILHQQVGENLAEVIGGLQRISRLRPTLLVLEDVHLFPSESIPDLVRLFQALVDETLSVLCISRPATIAAQGILEQYLVESITMKGLSQQSLTTLWDKLFGSTPPKGAIPSLYQATKGNPLAVRSGLRGVIQTGSVVQSKGSGRWEFAQTAAFFEQNLRRSVSLVVEGMIAHLSKEHRKAAEVLATLGEVFAREAALHLNPEMDEILADLMEEGIIVETFHPVSPLCGVPLSAMGQGWQVQFPASQAPLLAFTHSLLHDYLASRAKPDVPILLQLIGQDAPLYSLLPVRLFEKVRIPSATDIDVLTPVFRRVSTIAQALDRTANWKDGAELLGALNRLVEHVEGRDDVAPEVTFLWRMHTNHASLTILRRSIRNPEWASILQRQLALTEAPATDLTARYRMLAYSFLLDHSRVVKTTLLDIDVVEELDQLTADFPELPHSLPYIYVLESLLQNAQYNKDMSMVRLLHERIHSILVIPNLSEDMRATIIARVLSQFLSIFETPEELREREQSIPLIEQYRTESDSYYNKSKAQFLSLVGNFEEALRLIEVAKRRALERGLYMNLLVIQNCKLLCGVGLGYRFQEIVDETQTLLKSVPTRSERDMLAGGAAGVAVTTSLFLNRIDDGIEAATSFGVAEADFSMGTQLLIDLWRGNLESLPKTLSVLSESRIPFSHNFLNTLQEVARFEISDPNVLDTHALPRLIQVLDKPIVHIYDILTVYGIRALWKGLTDTPEPSILQQKIIERILASLEWLSERKIVAFMPPLTALLKQYDPSHDITDWQSQISQSAPVLEHQHEETPSKTIQISMLGTIRVAVPPDDFTPIRGIRIRTLLGLMVADRMVTAALSAEEFLAIAGGQESDTEHARKKKNMAVVRLREIVGHDAILTDGPTPQLNLELVAVDLLELNGLVQRAQDAVRQGAFVRALPLIEDALDQYNGDVVFPTLYEDFFEAARSDFEHRLRQAILEIGRGVLSMGDATGVEPFLRKAFDLLPGDEEIADVLREALEGAGNRTEAERIRMRVQG